MVLKHIINHYIEKDGMTNNSWCLETYTLSELPVHVLPPPTTPGLIPEGVGDLEIVRSLEIKRINRDLFPYIGGGVVWLPSPSFYCFGVPVVDLGCDHAIYFSQFISEFSFHMHISNHFYFNGNFFNLM